MNVKVRSEWKAGTDQYDVYIYTYDSITHRTSMASIVDGEMRWTIYDQGVVVPPTFTVPGLLLGGLRDELNKLGPFSDSPVDWLRDALGTRDRLFSLVEKLTDGKS